MLATLVSVAAPPAAAPPAAPPYDFEPHWSPDGTKIAFERDPGGAMVADAAGRQVLSLHGETSSWSPDGRRIAFSRDGAITVADRDASDAVRITSPPAQSVDLGPAWSPDGHTIAFERRPAMATPSETGTIWLIPAAGGEARRLDGRSEPEWNASWSPDSARLVFASCGGAACDTPRDGDHVRSDLFQERVDGTALVRLTRTGDNDRPQWSPDRGLIAFDRAHELDLSSTVDVCLVRPRRPRAAQPDRARRHEAEGDRPTRGLGLLVVSSWPLPRLLERPRRVSVPAPPLDRAPRRPAGIACSRTRRSRP
jgi:Tol biopolymer transport system component